jgi:hypothetical protein
MTLQYLTTIVLLQYHNKTFQTIITPPILAKKA